MNDLFDRVLRLSARATETGLSTMTQAIGSLQIALGAVTGQAPAADPTEPPLAGHKDIDRAVSDFANRAARIARYAAQTGGESVREAPAELLDAARHSFANFDLADPGQWLRLPLHLPLSLATLAAQELERGLHAFQIVGPTVAPGFLVELSEAFLDYPVYAALQYQEEIERYRRRLRAAPDDAAARVQLGRSYIKCGLYAEAAAELALAAEHPEVRRQALYESAIANYRGGHYTRAAVDGARALAIERDPRAQYWTWLAARKIGGYPPETPPDARIEMAAGLHPTTLRYEEVAARIGLAKTSGGRGTAVADFNGDGRLDLLISAVSGGCSLYRNNGDGTFTDVSVGSGLDTCVNAWGLAVADYNNDGLPDVFVTRLGFFDGDTALYRNNGDGTFTNVTKEAGVNAWIPGFTASWVDYDCDGHLDLFVPANLGGLFHRDRRDCLFHNNGDGTFTEVGYEAGLRKIAPSVGATWGDYDNDGYPDLFLSSTFGRSQLYHNNGDGTFTDVSGQAGVDEPCLGMVAFFCDYDDDGWLDIVQYVWCRYEDMLHSLRHGSGPPGGTPLRVYHNNRNGTFTQRSAELGITESWGSMSGNAGDLDNDGHLDLLLGNGGPQMDRTEPLVVLQNNGHGRFHNVTFTAGLPIAGKSHGANVADLHGDGRLSLIVAAGGMYPGDLLTTAVYRPRTRPGNYLNVRLVGTASNRDAIDARVRLDAGGRAQHRLVGGGSGFGCLPLEQHFGLGELTAVEALEVRWPSGLRQRFEGPPVNATIRLVEGADGWERLP